jgi:cell division protein FtsB
MMVGNGNRQKRVRRVVNKDSRGGSVEQKKTAPKSSGGFYYSFLTIILLLCLIQITISAVLNVSKVISYKAKIVQITHTRDAAMALNEQLKDNINNFSNVSGLEAIARNNLKMSSEDEVLVIINTPKDEEKEEKPNKKVGFVKHD